MVKSKKKTRNITGLRNQGKEAAHVHAVMQDGTGTDSAHCNDDNEDDEDSHWVPRTQLDSLKPIWDKDGTSDEEERNDDPASECCEPNWETDMNNEGLQVRMMMVVAMNYDDDAGDEDWTPESLRR